MFKNIIVAAGRILARAVNSVVATYTRVANFIVGVKKSFEDRLRSFCDRTLEAAAVCADRVLAWSDRVTARFTEVTSTFVAVCYNKLMVGVKFVARGLFGLTCDVVGYGAHLLFEVPCKSRLAFVGVKLAGGLLVAAGAVIAGYCAAAFIVYFGMRVVRFAANHFMTCPKNAQHAAEHEVEIFSQAFCAARA